MALKELTKEGRFECGLDALVKGKDWAFTAVVGDHCAARLGVAIANESGYVPVPETWAHADDYDAMEAHAEALNAAEGLDPKTAALIVVSTMGGIQFRRELAGA